MRTSCSTNRMLIWGGIGTSRIAMWRRSVDFPTPEGTLRSQNTARQKTRWTNTISPNKTIPSTMCKCESCTGAVIHNSVSSGNIKVKTTLTGYDSKQSWHQWKVNVRPCFFVLQKHWILEDWSILQGWDQIFCNSATLDKPSWTFPRRFAETQISTSLDTRRAGTDLFSMSI